MKRKFVISEGNTLNKLPFVSSAVVYLLICHFNPTDIQLGILYTVLGLWWLAAIIVRISQKPVDLANFLESVDFENHVKQGWPKSGKGKSRFEQKLEDRIKEKENEKRQ